MASSTTQRNGPALLARAQRVAVLLAVLVVAALGTGAVWWWSPAPPPPVTDSSAAVAGETLTTTNEAASPESVARSEWASPRTAVVGRALDSRGGPLAGIPVTLRRTDPKPVRARSLEIRLEPPDLQSYPPVFTESDAAGGFAFESLDAGNYRCHLGDRESQAESFALAAGEVRELTLQSQLVALTGTVFRRGEVMKDCLVEFDDGKERRVFHPGKTGVVRLFAAPGRYEVSVRPEPRANHSRTRGPCLSRQVRLVPDVPALQWNIETGGTQIAFSVEDPYGQAIDTYLAEIEGIGAFDQERGSYVLQGKRGEPAVMAMLPAGKWRATVTSDGFRLEPRDFVTGIDDGSVMLSFAALPAASLQLTLRPSSPFFPSPAADCMPALVVDGCAVTCKVLRIERGRAEVPPVFEYRAVPPGKATLCFQDRIDGDELVVLPFEPIAPVTIDLAMGRNEITVDVVPRAFVDLRGCDASGLETSSAVLTVLVDGRRVRPSVATTPQRWLGWLPRGVHRVVVDRNGTQREHVLRVDRSLVSERYRP